MKYLLQLLHGDVVVAWQGVGSVGTLCLKGQ